MGDGGYGDISHTSVPHHIQNACGPPTTSPHPLVSHFGVRHELALLRAPWLAQCKILPVWQSLASRSGAAARILFCEHML
jgi:hypothetical protein